MSGHHHHQDDPPPPPSDPRLRLRLYVDGELADETWLDATDQSADDITTATARMHASACQAAEAAGLEWRIEVYDPEAPGQLRILTIGTDITGPGTLPLWSDQ